ncbi:MAG: T9SS type A sorting domain-containing protein [Bacteroidetes bacterium]|nr:MAG: T9SS type A sorting domain-containing protein [Bacteroidota bacterium]
MKTRIPGFLIFLTLISLFSSQAQIDNLLVNGSSTNFSMVSGDTISWSYTVPIGATATFEFWLDVDHNGLVDTTIDKKRMTYSQTDGGGTGLPDMDGSVNGAVTFALPVGFAPADYIFSFNQGGVTLTCTGTVTPLPVIAHTVSGHVTPPPGKSAQYLFMQVKRRDIYSPSFWEGLTDSLGNYSIATSADTAGNPWTVSLADAFNPFQPAIISPANYTITLDGNPSGLDFVYLSTAAKVVGYFKDENGIPITNNNVSVIRFMTNSQIERRTTTDMTGFFEIDFLADDLSDDDYRLASYYSINTDYNLVGVKMIHGLHPGDSLYYDLVSYYVNSSIQGTVRINGEIPWSPVTLHGSVYDTAFTFTRCDSSTGNFSLPVSDKLYNYIINPENPGGFYDGLNVQAHPEQTGVIINLLCNPSSISGIVFNDANQNGNQDGEEAGLAGWYIQLSGATSSLTATNEYGQYMFLNLQPGNYTISEQVQSGWEQTSPSSPSHYSITLWAGNTENGRNFGNRQSGTQIDVLARWNLVSLPCTVTDAGKTTLFPLASSAAMLFNPELGYEQQETLKIGAGYWLKFPSAQTILFNGSPIPTDTINVKEGWNLIGSISNQVPVESIMSIPGGLVTSNFYGYGEQGYAISNTISPGYGYWVKVNQDGELILSSLDGGLSLNKIHILQTSELPPPPPGDETNENNTIIPGEFALNQNYPNPFNPTTIIRYQLPINSFVTLKVYSTLGKEVATLVEEFQASGFKSQIWDASGLPSGVYYYKLFAVGQVQGTPSRDGILSYTDVKKLLILK